MKLKVYPMVALLLATMTCAAQDATPESMAPEKTEVVDKSKLPAAPANLVEELSAECKTWASEDGVAKDELAKYLLNCVNSELDVMGYKAVDKLK